VSSTETCGVESPCSGPLRWSAAATIFVGSFAAPATTSAVCPSAEIEEPACGGTTLEILESPRRVVSTCRTTDRNAGDDAVSVAEWTTTIGAELESPPKSCCTRLRTATDSEPFACQPAPESAVSTLGAKTPSPTAIASQASEIRRT